MTIFKRFIRPALFSLEAEKSHNLVIRLLKSNLVPAVKEIDDPILSSVVFGRQFQNPIGLAAGFDKNAAAISNLYRLGFGFIEVGTVTPRPQSGNLKPRLFRLSEDDAIINSLGFNSEGLEVFRTRLKIYKGNSINSIVGANIGKNKDTIDAASDYVTGVRLVAEFADYIVVNISSPNTPGLRDLQKKSNLQHLLGAVLEERAKAIRQPPIVLKFSPDLDDQEVKEIAEAASQFNINGLIATNTTIERRGSLKSANKAMEGGLSGRPLMDSATAVLRLLYRYTGGQIPIIGGGGVFSGEDAYCKIRSGASLVQIYTAFIYKGPYAAIEINSALSSLLKKDGFQNISDAVGVDVPL